MAGTILIISLMRLPLQDYNKDELSDYVCLSKEELVFRKNLTNRIGVPIIGASESKRGKALENADQLVSWMIKHKSIPDYI